MDLLEFMMGLDTQYQLALRNMTSFTIELDILLVKNEILHIFNNCAKIKVDCYNSLPRKNVDFVDCIKSH